MCYGNLNNKMKFIQRYKSPKFIGILIDNNDRKVVVNDYKLLEIISQWKLNLLSII